MNDSSLIPLFFIYQTTDQTLYKNKFGDWIFCQTTKWRKVWFHLLFLKIAQALLKWFKSSPPPLRLKSAKVFFWTQPNLLSHKKFVYWKKVEAVSVTCWSSTPKKDKPALIFTLFFFLFLFSLYFVYTCVCVLLCLCVCYYLSLAPQFVIF